MPLSFLQSSVLTQELLSFHFITPSLASLTIELAYDDNIREEWPFIGREADYKYQSLQ
jgi:hypothetical protein